MKMKSYLVNSMVMIETLVEMDDKKDDVYRCACIEAGKKIIQELNDAGLDFAFCDGWLVFDEEGNTIEEEAA